MGPAENHHSKDCSGRAEPSRDLCTWPCPQRPPVPNPKGPRGACHPACRATHLPPDLFPFIRSSSSPARTLPPHVHPPPRSKAAGSALDALSAGNRHLKHCPRPPRRPHVAIAPPPAPAPAPWFLPQELLRRQINSIQILAPLLGSFVSVDESALLLKPQFPRL